MFHRIKKMFKVTFLRYLERFFLFVANNLLLLVFSYLSQIISYC